MECKLISVDDLKRIHRDLDSCQKVIWLSGGFDPAYCKDAQESLKLIDAMLSADPKASDLEIVQKALEHINRISEENHTITFWPGEISIQKYVEHHDEDETFIVRRFSGHANLLAWAKQQIGE